MTGYQKWAIVIYLFATNLEGILNEATWGPRYNPKDRLVYGPVITRVMETTDRVGQDGMFCLDICGWP